MTKTYNYCKHVVALLSVHSSISLLLDE